MHENDCHAPLLTKNRIEERKSVFLLSPDTVFYDVR